MVPRGGHGISSLRGTRRLNCPEQARGQSRAASSPYGTFVTQETGTCLLGDAPSLQDHSLLAEPGYISVALAPWSGPLARGTPVLCGWHPGKAVGRAVELAGAGPLPKPWLPHGDVGPVLPDGTVFQQQLRIQTLMGTLLIYKCRQLFQIGRAHV